MLSWIKRNSKQIWNYLDRFDRSEEKIIRVIRFELYVFSFAMFGVVFLGVLLQTMFIIWFVPVEWVGEATEILEQKYDPYLQMYNIQLDFNALSIIYDFIIFLIGVIILIKIKRRIRNYLKRNLDETEELS